MAAAAAAAVADNFGDCDCDCTCACAATLEEEDGAAELEGTPALGGVDKSSTIETCLLLEALEPEDCMVKYVGRQNKLLLSFFLR